MDTFTEDDHALAMACFALECELRQRGWDALERLAALLPEPGLNAALESCPERELAEVVGVALGSKNRWTRDGPFPRARC